MWPFRKKYPPINKLPDNDWTVGLADHDGDQIMVRINRTYRQICGHPDYSHQVGIAIPFESLPEGINENTLGDILAPVEDRITDSLMAKNEALLAIVITDSKMREFVFYTSNPDISQQKLERLQREIESMSLQFTIQHDPKWNIYKQFI